MPAWCAAHGAHDRLGGRCASDAHAGPEHHHLHRRSRGSRWSERSRRTRSRCRRRGEQRQAGRHHELGPVPDRDLGPDDRSDRNGRRDGQQAHARLERSVALEELEVLRDEEDEPREREEGHGHRQRWPRRSAGCGTGRRRASARACGARTATNSAGRSAAAPAGRRYGVTAHPASGASMIANTRRPGSRASRSRDPGCRQPRRRGIARGRHDPHDERRRDERQPGPWRGTSPGQAKLSNSAPPAIGPSAIARPVTAPHSPIARARSRRSVNTFVMIDNVVGKMIAAPTPMSARVAIRGPVAEVVRWAPRPLPTP